MIYLLRDAATRVRRTLEMKCAWLWRMHVSEAWRMTYVLIHVVICSRPSLNSVCIIQLTGAGVIMGVE